ncbi:MAG: 30S ribosomal protein S9 [Berkelbacteria bacterium GW2011_GWA2_35_9]|uniref:30S ribosomal protein S9 n=1 Tax=Berkelbacteria bacterium GW2011_GWA2_35_9 TaxID=1618333 RepID=A0A0G0D4S1_9BACT|nr:MAG: 30S ribosomal protein S9 [Berkelbacteria bacterium GW2011_GWA2_35_9]
MTETKNVKRQYYQGTGRRKRTVATVRIYKSKRTSTINKKEIDNFDKYIEDVFKSVGMDSKFSISIITKGGGFSSQKDAITMGIARALVDYDETLKPTLRKLGYLTRDSREKERKKPGLKSARKAPQWSKR